MHSRRTVAAVEFPPESAGYDSDRIHCMTCRTTITTPSLRAVVSLTPSLRIMITTPSNSNINTLTVNLQQVCTQLRWTPFTGKVNTMKEQNHPFVFLTPRKAVIKEPHLPRLRPASSNLARSLKTQVIASLPTQAAVALRAHQPPACFACLHVSEDTARRFTFYALAVLACDLLLVLTHRPITRAA